MVFALNVSIMGVVISHVLKCNIRFLKPQVEGDSITGLRTLLNSRAYPIKRNKICLFHQWVGLTFLWVSLLFSMKCCLEKGPGFRWMQCLPFWFLVTWKGSSSPKTVRVFSRGRDPWHLLSSRMALLTAASLSPRGSPPELSACSFNPAFCQPRIRCQMGTVCRTGPIRLWILQPLHPAWPCIPNKDDRYWVWPLLLVRLPPCQAHPSNGLRNTRHAHATVLVNGESATKMSFPKNRISGFMVPGSVESRDTLSPQEAGTLCSEKLSLSRYPCTLSKKKITSWIWSRQELNIPGRSYLVWCLLQEQKSSQSLCKNSVSQRSNRQKDFWKHSKDTRASCSWKKR